MTTTGSCSKAASARFVRDHLEPALYRAAAPLTVTGWRSPGEPVPFAEAVRRTYEPVEIGMPWGRPWGTTWFHVTGAVPAEWRRAGAPAPSRLVVDLGFAAGPGFQAEGLAYRPDGTIVKGVSPLNHYVPLDPEAPVGSLRRGRREPGRRAQRLHAHPVRRPGHRRRRTRSTP